MEKEPCNTAVQQPGLYTLEAGRLRNSNPTWTHVSATVRKMEPLLKVRNVSKFFGKFAAVRNVSFEVFPNEIFGIAGPNGAGKTTLFNLISRNHDLSSGDIIFDGRYVGELSPHQVCHAGIARTFQVPEVFRSLTVLENVMVGSTFGRPMSILRVSRQDERRIAKETAIKALDFVGLGEKKFSSLESLSLLEVKSLMIASALATNPKLLLLDEPVAGLSTQEIAQVTELMRQMNREGITIIMVEHIMKTLMRLSHRVMILDYGQKISEGTPEQVCRDEKVIEVYLGPGRKSE